MNGLASILRPLRAGACMSVLLLAGCTPMEQPALDQFFRELLLNATAALLL